MEIRVGQNVLYHPPGTRKELAAIVTLVHPNGFVNLAIFDPSGNVHQNPPTHIEVLQEGMERTTMSGHTCSLAWNPPSSWELADIKADLAAIKEMLGLLKSAKPLSPDNKGMTLEEMRTRSDSSMTAPELGGFPVGDLAEASERLAGRPVTMWRYDDTHPKAGQFERSKVHEEMTAVGVAPDELPPLNLPPGAEVIEHRAATPDEIAKANKATEKNPPKPKKLTNG